LYKQSSEVFEKFIEYFQIPKIIIIDELIFELKSAKVEPELILIVEIYGKSCF